jgi:hypothetical protein
MEPMMKVDVIDFKEESSDVELPKYFEAPLL